MHVDAGGGQAGARGDVAGGRRVEAAVGEGVGRSLEQAVRRCRHSSTPGRWGRRGRALGYDEQAGPASDMVDSMPQPSARLSKRLVTR